MALFDDPKPADGTSDLPKPSDPKPVPAPKPKPTEPVPAPLPKDEPKDEPLPPLPKDEDPSPPKDEPKPQEDGKPPEDKPDEPRPNPLPTAPPSDGSQPTDTGINQAPQIEESKLATQDALVNTIRALRSLSAAVKTFGTGQSQVASEINSWCSGMVGRVESTATGLNNGGAAGA